MSDPATMEYLCKGGLVNPELMEHDKVRNLIIDLQRQLAEAQGDALYCARLEAELAEAQELLDWAETLLCNALPMSHCTSTDWAVTITKWRDAKNKTPKGDAK